jgi:hypothetical protein
MHPGYQRPVHILRSRDPVSIYLRPLFSSKSSTGMWTLFQHNSFPFLLTLTLFFFEMGIRSQISIKTHLSFAVQELLL